MKTIIPAALLLNFLLLQPEFNIAQESNQDNCTSHAFHDQCYLSIQGIFDDFVYIKSRPFLHDMEDVKFTVSMRKDILYLINICEGENAKVEISLYDDLGRLIASNYNPKNKKFSRAIHYISDTGGKYDIVVKFMDKDNVDCAVIMFGMIKRNIGSYFSKTN